MDFARNRVNRLISRNCKIVLVLFVVTLTAGILQVAGYASPGWVVLINSNTSDTFSQSVWYTIVCSGGECQQTYALESAFADE